MHVMTRRQLQALRAVPEEGKRRRNPIVPTPFIALLPYECTYMMVIRKYRRNARAATHMSGRTFFTLPVTMATMT